MERSFELDLALGLANLLADNPEAEVPLWSQYSAEWDEVTEAYVKNPPRPAGAIPILIDSYDGDGPYVVLTEYSVDDSVSGSPVIGVQLTIRAEKVDTVRGVSSDIYALLHQRWGGMLGTVKLVDASRSSGTNVGQDSNNRRGRVENYYIRAYRPTPNRQE